jgi:hypothetical protein
VQLPEKSVQEMITRTTVVSFRQESDALKMAHLLESHKAINKAWPSTLFDDTFSLHLFTNNNANANNNNNNNNSDNANNNINPNDENDNNHLNNDNKKKKNNSYNNRKQQQ